MGRIIVFGVFFGPGGLSYAQIGLGIQNLTKILPAYMRTRVSHGPMYAQGHQETKVILLKKFIFPFPQTVWSKIRRISEFSIHLHITMDVWKTPKIESCYTIFCSGNGN